MKFVMLDGRAEYSLNMRGDLFHAARNRGHHVTLVAPSHNSSEIGRKLRSEGIDFSGLRLNRHTLNPAADLLTMIEIARTLRRIGPDVLLAATAKAVSYGLVAAKLVGVPHRVALLPGLGYAFTEGDEWRRRLLRKVLLGVYKSGLACAHTVVFQNSDDMQLLKEKRVIGARHRVEVVGGSGVDLEHFRLPPPDFSTDRIHFLFSGRLLSDKGVREFARAAEIVKGRTCRATFGILGAFDNNPSRIDCAELETWERDGIVSYFGEVADVRSRLAWTHVLVMPSYREGTPKSVLEALAAGRPVITTDVPGCRQTVRNGWNGFLVPPRDADALATAMMRFIEDPKLIPVMGANGRKHAETFYDVAAVNGRLLALLGL